MVQNQAKVCKFYWAHLRWIIRGIGKSRATFVMPFPIPVVPAPRGKSSGSAQATTNPDPEPAPRIIDAANLLYNLSPGTTTFDVALGPAAQGPGEIPSQQFSYGKYEVTFKTNKS